MAMEHTQLFTASQPATNAQQALTCWEAAPDTTIFVGQRGGYAVVLPEDVWMFAAYQWKQTSPEEITTLLTD